MGPSLAAAALVLLLAADPAPDAEAAPPVVRLGDPALSPDLKGAILLVKKANGAFVQGLVTKSDAERLVIDSTHEIVAADIASILTVRPARFPVHMGDFVTVTLLSRAPDLRGRVVDLGDDTVTLQFDGKDARMKWGAIATVQVGMAIVAPVTRPEGTIVELTPVTLATPTPGTTPEPERKRETETETPLVFGDKGNVEVGGTFDFARGSVDFDNGIRRTSANGYVVDARPYLGYFLAPGFEVMAQVVITSSVTDFNPGGDEWRTYTGLRAGAAYFFRRPSGIALGPQLLVGSYADGSETQDVSGVTFDFEERGWDTAALLALRVPIGESALLSMGFGLYRGMYKIDYYPGGLGSSGSGSRSGFETSIGFSVWIPTS